MTGVKINLKVKSSTEKPYILETIGEADETKLTFKDKSEKTTIFFEKPYKICKESKDYILNLIFIKNKSVESLYQINNPFCSFKTNVFTKNIIKKHNFLKIDYDLFLEDNKTGSFEIEISWINL